MSVVRPSSSAAHPRVEGCSPPAPRQQWLLQLPHARLLPLFPLTARDAVLHLHVQLRHDVNIVDRGILEIALGSGLNHVAHDNALDGLVL
jgi:hypothetical protein